ncbi:MAG TPA: hypothetical protein VIL28_12245 [Steroidobacteraceae bacterium]
MKHVLYRLRRWLRAAGGAAAICVALAVSGCGSVTLVATANIPQPLITKVPMTVALYVPEEFASYVHKEERWSTDWNIDLGKAQTEGITRLVNAMFERVVLVDSLNAATQVEGVSAILEPSVEEYAFVTPRDAGTPFFAVSIKYRVNVYLPDGRLADSWGFTGYGTAPSQGLSSSAPLAHATALALRDAGAKLAVEFREQAVVRSLLPAGPSDAETSSEEPSQGEAPSPPAESAPTTDPAGQTPPASEQETEDETKPEQEQEKDDEAEQEIKPAMPLGARSVARA